MLFGLRSVAACTEHVFARQVQLHRTIHHPGRDGTQNRVRPDKSLAPEAAPNEWGDDMDLFLSHAKGLRDGLASSSDPLRGFVERQLVTVP